jgi:hypothetical protein
MGASVTSIVYGCQREARVSINANEDIGSCTDIPRIGAGLIQIKAWLATTVIFPRDSNQGAFHVLSRTGRLPDHEENRSQRHGSDRRILLSDWDRRRIDLSAPALLVGQATTYRLIINAVTDLYRVCIARPGLNAETPI